MQMPAAPQRAHFPGDFSVWHNCTWITVNSKDELTLFPAVPGNAISTSALPSGEAVTFVELVLFIAKEWPVMYKNTVFMV